MLKKICLFIFLLLPLSNCASVDEFKERAKGDGIPYIPGI
jgi:hypothetical protein|tara:strand:- start:97 stop:216 length:120 start_codon:yes stop_codon:yes gene_type:complete